ncbi:hypothetical protein [Halobellus sp. EA9]
MSAETTRFGVAHPTVVPGNHPGAGDADEAPADEDTERAADKSS